MYNKKFRPRKVLIGIVFAVSLFLLFAFVVMLLWNAILPETIHVNRLNYGHALGILALSKILFGGFHGGWGRRGRWRQNMEDKWSIMTPEEREKFREQWKQRCGRWGQKGGDQQATS